MSGCAPTSCQRDLQAAHLSTAEEPTKAASKAFTPEPVQVRTDSCVCTGPMQELGLSNVWKGVSKVSYWHLVS